MEQEPTLERVVEALRAPVRIDPDLDRRVMAAIERLPRPASRRSRVRAAFEWLVEPRTIRLSPLGGLAIAAGLAVVVFTVTRIAGPGGVPAVPEAGDMSVPEVPTQFVLVAPEAASVSLVGDFNDWSPSATPLVRQAGDGIWWVTIPLRPGRYRYAFIVDGEIWRGDPNAPAAEDEFGRPNSVVTIGGA